MTKLDEIILEMIKGITTYGKDQSIPHDNVGGSGQGYGGARSRGEVKVFTSKPQFAEEHEELKDVNEAIDADSDMQIVEAATELFRRYGPQLIQRIGKLPDPKKYTGLGKTAAVYDIGGGKVFKITYDKADAEAAMEVKDKRYKHIVNVADVFKFPKHHPVWGIVAEKLNSDVDEDTGQWLTSAKWLLEKFAGKPWKEVETFLNGARSSDPTGVQKIMDIVKGYKLDSMFDELAELGFSSEDLHYNNFMFREDGTLVLSDLGRSKSRGTGKPIPILEGVGNWARGLAAAGALAAATPATDDWQPPRAGMGDVAVAGGKEGLSIDELATKAAKATGVRKDFIMAMIKIESNFNVRAVSGVGAQGLMQLMPATAKGLGVKDPFDAEQNIMGGARYIKQLAAMFNGDPQLVTMAYNVGPYAAKKILRTEKMKKAGKWIKKKYHWPEESKKHWAKMSRIFGGDDVMTISVASNEGTNHPRGHGPTDLSGKKLDPTLPDDVSDSSDVVGDTIRRRLMEVMGQTIGVIVGRFQPFHVGHENAIRKLMAQTGKVIIFVSVDKEPFSYAVRSKMILHAMSDVADRLDIKPAIVKGQKTDDLPTLLSAAGISPTTKLAVMTNDKDTDDGNDFSTIQSQIANSEFAKDTVVTSAGKDATSGNVIRQEIADGNEDSVRNYMAPKIKDDDVFFKQVYKQMRDELDASGQDTKDVITEFTGAEFGNSRMGAHGTSAWSSGIAALAKNRSGDGMYDQNHPSTRMLDLTNPGVADDHMPGEELDQRIDDEEDMRKPTDLNDFILRKLKSLMG